MDHFGFICRETAEEGSCHFVCYVFQCANESLVRDMKTKYQYSHTQTLIIRFSTRCKLLRPGEQLNTEGFSSSLLQVDEIMLTLKQAFSKAVEWKKSNTQWQQCDSCPLLQFHRLCERIEGGKHSLLCVTLDYPHCGGYSCKYTVAQQGAVLPLDQCCVFCAMCTL